MIPTYIISLKQFPLMTNGKIDRNALPDPKDSAISTKMYVAPKTKIERELQKVWQEVLQRKKIGITDNFFEMGGHSLRAIKIIAEVHKQLNVEIPLRELFSNNTIQEFAKMIEQSAHKELIKIPKIKIQDSYSLSNSQQRLWILDQIEADNYAYNIPLAYEMKGDVDKSALQLALQKVLEWHESLRTNFIVRNGAPRQVISDDTKIQIEEFDLSRRKQKNELAQKYAEQEAKKPFDLHNDSHLIRAKLLKLGKNRYVFLLTMHHIVSDGWSMEVLITELAELYNSFKKKVAFPHPPFRIQYTDYSAWQHNYLASDAAKNMISIGVRNFQESCLY